MTREHGQRDDIIEELKALNRTWRRIERDLYEFLFPAPRALQISQIIGGKSMAITGIAVGATGTFGESPSAPPGAVEPSGTVRVWSTSDTANTSLTPSADGTSVAVAVGTSAPVGGSFVLTVTDTFPDATTAVGTATVPYLAPPTPEPTALQINQLS